LDIGVLGYIGIVQHKEHSPEVLSIPPGTPCIFFNLYGLILRLINDDLTTFSHCLIYIASKDNVKL